MRISAESLAGIGDADLREELDDASRCRRGASLMESDDLADLLFDRVQRVQRGHRLLKDHGHRGTAHFAQLCVGHFEHVPAAKEDFAGRITRRRQRQQADDRLRSHGLARARFANQRQRAALLQCE